MSSASGKAKIPTISFDSGLYGSVTSGKTNSFNPNQFQTTLVQTAQNGMNDYLKQMVDPSYDDSGIKNQISAQNKLATQSYINSVVNPLSQRGFNRDSFTSNLNQQFNSTLSDLKTSSMANASENAVTKLNQLSTLYQLPYDMSTKMRDLNNQVLQNNTSAQSQAQSNQAQLIGNGMNFLKNVGSKLLSDARLKENLSVLEVVDDCPIYLFDYINGSKNQIGVVAQDILDKYPQAVFMREDGYYEVDYNQLPKAVQNKIQEWKSKM